MPAEFAIEAQGLHKAFGPVQALDDVSFRVEEGTVLGLAAALVAQPPALFLDEPTVLPATRRAVTR